MKNTYLTSENRPAAIKHEIQKTYDKISATDISNWGLYNGQDTYNLFSVSETYLLKHIINKHHNQKEFYVLEVGAGNFQFGRYLVEFINNKFKDIVVNMFSVRGEMNNEPQYSQIQNCKIWELGSFMIENLSEELSKKLGSDLSGKFDLIVSHYTLRHLVDAPTTFINMYNLLKIHDGLMTTDTFNFQLNVDNGDCYGGIKILLSHINTAGDEFLVTTGSDTRGYPCIALKKHNEDLKLPFDYDYYTQNDYSGEYCQIYKNNNIILLDSAFEPINKVIFNRNATKNIAGSKLLFKEITEILLLELKDKLEEVSTTLSLDHESQIDTYNNSEEFHQNYSFEQYMLRQQSLFKTYSKNLESVSKCVSENSNNFYCNWQITEYIDVPFVNTVELSLTGMDNTQ